MFFIIKTTSRKLVEHIIVEIDTLSTFLVQLKDIIKTLN